MIRVLLLGLGRANLPVARYLLQKGIKVFIYEDKIEDLSESAKKLIDSGKIQSYRDGDEYELVITSPGFSPSKDIIKKMAAMNIPIIDEIEFTYQELKNPKIIAITGTNGKSTTVTLISNILNAGGVKNFLGGNIAPGIPFSQTLFEPKFDYYVLEVSSFQLMRINKFCPTIGVITNIGIDHLNWHKDYDEYVTAKKRIFLNQGENDFAVLNYDDELVRELARIVKSKVVYFGTKTRQGAWLNGDFYFNDDKLFSVEHLPLTGAHNLMNIAAAIAVAKILSIGNESIEAGIKKFRTLPHRLEDIGSINGIRYINNSMCTNAGAAIASFMAIKGNKIVILGGKHKGEEGKNYLDLLTEEAKACVVLGENADFVVDYFKTKCFEKFTVAKDMCDAVEKARKFAQLGDIILLNPGYASFDYFTNFEERGEAFKDAAHRN